MSSDLVGSDVHTKRGDRLGRLKEINRDSDGDLKAIVVDQLDDDLFPGLSDDHTGTVPARDVEFGYDGVRVENVAVEKLREVFYESDDESTDPVTIPELLGTDVHTKRGDRLGTFDEPVRNEEEMVTAIWVTNLNSELFPGLSDQKRGKIPADDVAVEDGRLVVENVAVEKLREVFYDDTSTSGHQSSSEPKDKLQDGEIEEDIASFAQFVDEEVPEYLERASPEQHPEIAEALQSTLDEIRDRVRELDRQGQLAHATQHLERIDDMESIVRDFERKAIERAESARSRENDTSFTEAVAQVAELRRQRKEEKPSIRERSSLLSDPKPDEPDDPYTGPKASSRSLTEKFKRAMHTIKGERIRSPKCPRCNRSRTASVSGEEHVYQCDNCGNIFDTRSSAQRDININVEDEER